MKTTTVVLFILTNTLISCVDLDDPRNSTPLEKVISMHLVDENGNQIKAVSIKADSLSNCLLKIVLNDKSDDSKTVTVSTTAGVLTKPGESPTAISASIITVSPIGREALVQLNALDQPQDKVIVSATVGTSSAVDEVTFAPSLPEELIINPTIGYFSKDEDAIFDIRTLKALGVVSEKIEIKITSIAAPDSVPIGFPSSLQLRNGKARLVLTNKSRQVSDVMVTLSVLIATDSSIEKTFKATFH